MAEQKYKVVLSNQKFYEEVLLNDRKKTVKVGTELNCDVRLYKECFTERFRIEFVLLDDTWSVRCSDNLYIYTGDVRKLTQTALSSSDTMTFRYSSSNLDAFMLEVFYDYDIRNTDFRRVIDIGDKAQITLGNRKGDDIILESPYLTNDVIEMTRMSGGFRIRPLRGAQNLFINGDKAFSGGVIRDSDFFRVADMPFFYREGKLWTEAGNRVQVNGLQSVLLPERTGYPKFVRNTRERIMPSQEAIEILDPPAKPTKQRTNLLMSLLPSLGMMLTSGIMATMGGYMVMYSLVSGAMAIIIAIAGIISSKKDFKKDLADRKTKYLEYEKTKRAEIEKARAKEREDLEEIYVGTGVRLERLEAFSGDLFDRSPEDEDFLDVRIGTGSVDPLRKIEHKKQEILETDELFEIPDKIAGDYAKLEKAPVVLRLRRRGVIGIVGSEKNRYEMLKNILFDMCTRQYPTDFSLFLVVKPENFDELAWTRMLPELNEQDLGIRHLACSDESRNKVFDHLYKELSKRDKENRYRQIVVIFYDEYGFLTHPASRFMRDAADYCCTFLFMGENKTDIPMYCDELVYMNSKDSGEVVDTHDKSRRTAFRYTPVDDRTIENMAFELAPVNTDEISLEGQLTKSITLYQLLGIYSTEDLDLTKRWRAHSAERSMAVPIGVTVNNVVYLDLHDKAHGPHGLVAGTTGSGKSELLQTYVLSIAVNYHPYEVGFVIIDFKGGGMANQFRTLPHLLGAITNIDGKEVDRSLRFIRAELERRQRYFNQAGVNHIDKYIKAFKDGAVSEPLPHLILIVDEFAELKAQHAEFMQELISAARIGRSLGVHLILATQKPAGQVDEQIWSNSRFKLCLKVQEQQDSDEVLRTPVAAEIKEPGRAYFQVGNNEIFELFQSAYSGAADRVFDDSKKEFTIYEVSGSGERTPVYSSNVKTDETEGRTQLEAVVDYVGREFRSSGQRQLPGICLPPLRRLIDFEEDKIKKGGQVCIGYYDDPDRQAQPEALIEIEEKNTFILGASRYGKTNLIMSLIRNICFTDPPEQSAIYIIDFGTMILKQFESLNHVGGVVTSAEDEKLKNLIKLLEEEIVLRKERMMEAGVSSFTSYREAGNRDLPHIYLMIDNMTAAMELYFEDDDSLLRIIREGAAVGITTIAANVQTAGISYRYFTNFANKIVLYCNDSSEYLNAFDHVTIHPDEVPGRCILAIDDQVVECQTFLAFPGEKEYQRIEMIQKFTSEMNKKWERRHVKKIPYIPATLTEQVLNTEYAAVPNRYRIPIGLTYRDVKPFYLDVRRLGLIGLCGGEEERHIAFIKYLFDQMSDQADPVKFSAVILDDFNRKWSFMEGHEAVENYTLDIDYMTQYIVQLQEILSERYDRLMEGGSIEEDELKIVIIQNNDFAARIEEDMDLQYAFEQIVSKYRDLKAAIIFSNYKNADVPYDAPMPLLRIRDDRHVLYWEDLEHLKVFDVNLEEIRNNKRKMEKGDAFYISGDELTKLKLVT